ncbi:ATP-binding protein [Saccharibacillus sacchari]|uniref:ATP-binding protein n=1 Tax=Saccharibacillus sacchari TaxID=456493 RepID=A0ACC6PFV9_9BACL
MLMEFTVGNFLSFKDKVTFKMVASSIREHRDTHTFNAINNIDLLKSSVLYGANASGKSNLFKAMTFMSQMVRNSSKESQAGEEIEVVPFKLNTYNEQLPSFFEIVFIKEDRIYRYGFEVNCQEVVSEWLFQMKKNKEQLLFDREKEDFEVSELFAEGKMLTDLTRNNALFLSVAANFKGDISNKVLSWFRSFNIVSGLVNANFPMLHRHLKNKEFKKELLDMLRNVDLGFEDIDLFEEEVPGEVLDAIFKLGESLRGLDRASVKEIKNEEIKTFHKKFDVEDRFVSYEEFKLMEEESEGTRKLFSLLAPIMDTLKQGKVLVVDELDAKLHPILTQFIISLFNSNIHNPHEAQLIFNSHDTNLLHRDHFRRDQIWFAEKDRYGATDLYSLSDFKVRSDASYEKDYLLGKYGSIPFIGEFHFTEEGETSLDGE